MQMLPHQLHTCPPLSLFESLGQSRKRPAPALHPHFPSSFPSTSIPRDMAHFCGLGAFEALQSDEEPRCHPGDNPTDVQPVDWTNDMTQYQPRTPPETESYWSHSSFPAHLQLDNQYLQPHINPPSPYTVTSWGNSSSSLAPYASAPGSNYSSTQHSPPHSSHSLGPYSAVQQPSDGRRSRSSELVLSPYGSPSHVSPPPATPIHPFGISLVEDPATFNFDSHREQLQLFRDALQLPMSQPVGPFVPQKMYIPHTNSDRRRYVDEIELQSPIYFWMQDPEECGFPLADALHSRVRRLQFRDEPVFEGRGPSISVRIQWPGYRQWSRQIPTKDFRSPPQPITKAKLAKNIAKCVERFLNTSASQRLEDEADLRWKVGPRPTEIKLDDLILAPPSFALEMT
ncbi:hypothetical protein D9615_007457 [Tricholomella constricta]|uniref:Uncharacterized protein n=1 Tax=Tricholomella constricta TaxID=117010 RepID=A0A8H5GYE3_9AGAR|nr:hypothetical protein D9615_007457 [Tricholomella constricta]